MMVRKLRHLLIKKEPSSLLFRSALLTALLAGFAFQANLWVFAFLVFGILFYFVESSERGKLKVSYFLVLLLSPLVISFLEGAPIPESVIFWTKTSLVLLAGGIFALIFGLIEYYFEKRLLAYTLLNTVLLLFVFVSAATFIAPYSLGWPAVVLFVALFLVFREIFLFFGIHTGRRIVEISHKRSLVAAFALALVGVQVFWFVHILPLGIINAAVFLTLIFVLLRDFVLAHFKGKLNLGFIMRQATFLVALTIIIFASTSWSL